MLKPYVIRRAHANGTDAALLQAVEHDSLGDSEYTPQEMLAVLSRPEQAVYLACESSSGDHESAVVGFCACLRTALDVSSPCLEVDMLGVLEAHRGRGVARQLIQHAMLDARKERVTMLRAVVAEDNLASQRAFEHAGFHRAAPIRRMLVHELEGEQAQAFLPQGWQWQGPKPFAPAETGRSGDASVVGAETHALVSQQGRLEAQSQCLAVHTLAYSGLWIESLAGATSAARACMAHALVLRAMQLDLDEVGCLAPTDAEGLLHALTSQGYQDVGRYWHYDAELAR